MAQKGSGDGRRRRLGAAFRAAERVSNPVQNLVGRGQPITDAAKSKLYELGIEGHATILKAPSRHRVSRASLENVGRFTAKVELPGEEPYEVNVWQSFWGPDWDALQPGTTVHCRVDPDDRDKVLLVVPESAEPKPRKRLKGPTLNLRGLLGREFVDSSELIASGRRATATVLSSEPMGMTAPDTEDQIYLLRLALSADDEPESWEVEFGQRVPKGAEEMVAVGRDLEAAFTGVNDPERVAIDWPATSGGRFS